MSLVDYLESIAVEGVLSYPQFIEAALFHPEFGYYRKNKKRVDYSVNADFYTALSVGDGLMGRLVLDACKTLCPDLSEYHFVEIGAEPESALLKADSAELFAGNTVCRVGDAVTIPNKAIVFSNELLDAQPFYRLIFHDGQWRERAIRLHNGEFEDVLLEAFSQRTDVPEGLKAIVEKLPKDLADGYELDLPLQAGDLLMKIVQQPWEGYLMFFDYGLDAQALYHERPQGTARTYHNHQMGNNLLDKPGECDITCHVCWDDLETILLQNGFTDVKTYRQESFFMQYAQRAIEAILMEGVSGKFSKLTNSLIQLLHPAHMGASFQVLYGVRRKNNN